MLPYDAAAPFRPLNPLNSETRQYARWEGVPEPRAPTRARPAARGIGLAGRLSRYWAARRSSMPTDERFLLDTLAERRTPGRP